MTYSQSRPSTLQISTPSHPVAPVNQGFCETHSRLALWGDRCFRAFHSLRCLVAPWCEHISLRSDGSHLPQILHPDADVTKRKWWLGNVTTHPVHPLIQAVACRTKLWTFDLFWYDMIHLSQGLDHLGNVCISDEIHALICLFMPSVSACSWKSILVVHD